MNHARKIIAGFTASLMALTATGATNEIIAPGDAHNGIAVHNTFNLKPLAIAPAASSPPETIAKITLTGIMSIFGPTQVLFKASMPNENGQSFAENSYILGEGQSQNGIEVLHINNQARLVTFNNHGVLQEISLANANEATVPTLLAPPAAKVDFHPIDFERSRTPDYLGGGSDQSSAGEPFRNKTLDERIIMIEAQRAYYKSQNDPRADQLPPTAMTPHDETTSVN